MQRIVWLHGVELVGGDDAFAKRRHPQIDKRVMERPPAMAADRLCDRG
jgi:hypothetical protein